MNKILLSFVISIFCLSTHAEITKSKAMELGVHRLERLVITKKISPTYQDRFQSIKIEDLTTPATSERFLVTFFQFPLSDGQILWLKLTMDENGKTLNSANNYIKEDHDALLTPVPAWPEKDIVTLTEEALHFVIENGPNKPEIKPYDEKLLSLSSMQLILSDQSLRAVFAFRAFENEKVLKLVLKPSGEIESSQIVVP